MKNKVLIKEHKKLSEMIRLTMLTGVFLFGIFGILLVFDTYLSWHYCYKLQGRSPYKSHIDCYVSPYVYHSDIVKKRPYTIFGYMRFHLETKSTAEEN
jgi:hypothetical protein